MRGVIFYQSSQRGKERVSEAKKWARSAECCHPPGLPPLLLCLLAVGLVWTFRCTSRNITWAWATWRTHALGHEFDAISTLSPFKSLDISRFVYTDTSSWFYGARLKWEALQFQRLLHIDVPIQSGPDSICTHKWLRLLFSKGEISPILE